MRKSKKNDAGDRNCRLCAKNCTPKNVLDLSIEKVKGEEVVSILSSINITYIDFSSKPNLGNVICSLCYKFLIKIQQFLNKVQKAQEQIKEMAPNGSCSTFVNFHNSSTLGELNNTHPEPESNIVSISIKVESIPAHEDAIAKQVEDSDKLTDNFQYKKEDINDENEDNIPLKELKFFEETSWYKIEMGDTKSIKTDTETHDLDEAETSHYKAHSESEVQDKETAHNYEFLADMKSTNSSVDKNEILKSASLKKDKRKNTENIKANVTCMTEYCWTCTLCEAKVESKDHLSEHMTKEHNIFHRKRRPNKAPITEEYLTCNMCVPNKVFNTTALLTTHHWKYHNPKGMMKHICHQCGKGYTKDALKYHLMKHDGIKPFVCQVCNMSFVDNIHLVMHAKVHTNIKPYKCSQCDKAFRRKQLLRNHSLIHSGEKPFACQHCDKRFRCISNLKTHEHIHTGLYPFECKQCGKKFSCWGNCDKHMKKAHNTTLAKTKATPQGKFPIDPKTGEVIKPPDLDLEEWQRNLMTMSTKYKKTLKGY